MATGKEKEEKSTILDPVQLAPLLAGQRFLGVIRSYNSNSGFGFIACAETRQIFGRDVFIQRQEVEPSGATVGATVSFTVELRMPDNKPQARNVQVEAPGMGAKAKSMDTMQLMNDMLTEVATNVLERSYLGYIKSWDVGKGTGFASSEDTHKVFGCDVLLEQLPSGLQVGDVCQFKIEIDLDKGTPTARDVATAPEGAADKLAMDQMAAASSAPAQQLEQSSLPGGGALMGTLSMPTDLQVKAMAPLGRFLFEGGSGPLFKSLQEMMDKVQTPEVTEPDESQKKGKLESLDRKHRFVGIIRSFNRARGFGFVACDETHAMFGSDVFLHNEQREGFEVGDVISFALEPRGQQARARDLKAASNPQDRGYSPSCSPDRGGQRGFNRTGHDQQERHRSRSCSHGHRRHHHRSRSRRR